MPEKVALITGASSGIGAEFARQLALKGYCLILVARRKDKLQELASKLKTSSEVFVADLADPYDVTRVAARIRSEHSLDLLINNAGFGTKLKFWEADLDGQRRMHQVHVMATVELTHAALSGMVPRGHGGVINVASVAAFAHTAGNASYSATKTWMVSFTEGLALDLHAAASAVEVQALCPGFTYTEFHDVLGVDRKRIARPFWMRAEDVVRESLGQLGKRLIVIPGRHYRLFVGMMGSLPGGVRRAILRRSPHTRDRL